MRTLVLLIASPHFSAELWYDQLWPLFFSVVNGAKSASQKVRIFARPHTLPAKVFHRAPVRADSCSSVGSRRASPCPAERPEGHNGFILPVRGLRIDVAPAIPFLRFLLRQLEGALRRGKGDNRLMLPAVPLIVQFRRAHADARKAHLAEQGSKASGNSHSSLSRCHSVWPASHLCQQPWRRQLPRRPPGPSAA